MESTLLNWKEPLAARSWKRQAAHLQGRAAVVFRIYCVSMVLFVLFGGSYSVMVGRFGLFIVALYVIFSPGISLWSFGRVTPTYAICEDGLRVHEGFSSKHYQWNDVEWFVIESLTEAPGVSWLRFKVTRKGKLEWPLFYFDRQQVNEQELMNILNRYLPTRQL